MSKFDQGTAYGHRDVSPFVVGTLLGHGHGHNRSTSLYYHEMSSFMGFRPYL